MNAYLLFAKEMKMLVLRDNPLATQDDIDKLVHQRWRHDLTSEEKRPYFDRAERLRREAASKQQRKRDRGRVSTVIAASTGSTAGLASLTASFEGLGLSGKTNSAPVGEIEARSAPASPDSGCPSTPDRSEAASISPVASLRRQSKTNGKTSSITPANHLAASMSGIYPNGQPIPYPPVPMVPQVFPHPTMPFPYLQPFCFPPPPMMHPQMPPYYAAAQGGLFASYMGGQMNSQPTMSTQPYYAMPMYPMPPHLMQPASCVQGSCCSAASASTAAAASAAAFTAPPSSSAPLRREEIGCGDAGVYGEFTINHYEVDDDKSDYSLNDFYDGSSVTSA